MNTLPDEYRVTWASPDRYARHKLGCTLFAIEPPISHLVLNLADEIRDEDLAEGGREMDPHVTIKFGLHTGDWKQVARVVKDFGPVLVTLGEVSIFDGPDFDIVKVDVHGDELRKLNRLISESLECTDTHPEYHPHVTLAYCKPGEGQKYVGNKDLEGAEVTFTRLVFSNADGAEKVISLVPD